MQTLDRCAEPSASLSLEAALAQMSAAVAAIDGEERLPLLDALGRVLAQDRFAAFDLPPFANSAMDGYALRHADIAPQFDRPLRVIGTALAGQPFGGVVGEGDCVRIFTGAALPAGADSVVMQEDTRRDGEHVCLTRMLSAGANVRPAGDEISAGERLLSAGRRLQAADLGVLASAGIAQIAVKPKLRVAFFSTGDELCPLGEPLGPGQIHDSNRYLLHGLLQDACLNPLDFGIVRDDPALLKQTLQDAAAQADVIITTGGVSVGDADFITRSLAELGRVSFWKVALKPGKPFAFGQIGSAWLFGLPGNPVAVSVTFRQLVRPVLLKLAGASIPTAVRLPATCQSTLKKAPGRMEFQRGLFRQTASGLMVESVGGQGSHQLLGVSRANCWIVLPTDALLVSPGETVLIEPFGDYGL